MTRLQSRLDGILLGKFSEVHRDNGRGRTGCGRPVLNPVEISANEAHVNKIQFCTTCWPYLQGRPR